jgi:hypothetical protein
VRAASVADLREVAFLRIAGEGALTVYPGADPRGVPFPIARVFTLGGVPAGGTRGNHAHRACAQLLVGLAGRAEARVDDGRDARVVALDAPERGLLVPPGLWLELRFDDPATLVAVFCDRPFEESDYVRDRAAYLRARGVA